jgi:hypothetical protein
VFPLAAAALLAGQSGCGTLLRGVSFSGTARPRIVAADRIADLDAAPPDHDELGSLEARCTAEEGEKGVAAALLGDGACSESSLISDLKQKASAVGGDAIVGRSCTSSSRVEDRTRKKDGKEETYRVTITDFECGADVVRPVERLLRPRLARPDEPGGAAGAPATPGATREQAAGDGGGK